MPSKNAIGRRAILRGAGGVAIALPGLEAMFNSHGTAHADQSAFPKRYFVSWMGGSIGAGQRVFYPNCVESEKNPLPFTPKKSGADYDLPLGLAPLAGGKFTVAGEPSVEYESVKNEVSVISGMEVPFEPGPIPDDFKLDSPFGGALRADAHDRDYSLMGATAGRNRISSDILARDAIGGNTTRIKVLHYRVQASQYGECNSCGNYGISSNAAGLTISPKRAFQALFSGAAPTTDASQIARNKLLLDDKKSVIDLVKERTSRLLMRVGAADKRRLDRHFSEIRDLERRISTLAPTTAYKEPVDPPVAGDLFQSGTDGSVKIDGEPGLGYSQEETRAQILMDLIYLGFQGDISRVAAVMFTATQSAMNFRFVLGFSMGLHEITHNGKHGTIAPAIAWHVKHYARLVAKLRDTPEGAGRLLDNCALVFMPEAGWGADSGDNPSSPHSSANMACLIAGGAGGMKQGRHIVVGPTKQPGHVIREALTAVGVPGDKYGECIGGIPELRDASSSPSKVLPPLQADPGTDQADCGKYSD